MAAQQRTRVVVGPGDVAAFLVFVLGAALGAWGLHAGLHVAPIERELKMTQKIFYLHAPLGIWTIVAAVVGAACAIGYLWKRRERHDLLSAACMDVCLVTCGVVLVTGSLWAKPAWGDWFPWGEPRVTGMLVLFLLLAAYRAMRTSVDEPERRARFSAVMAIMGGVVAVFAYAAIHVWNTTHPRVISPQGIGLQADMKRAFFICTAAMALLTLSLVQARYRIACLAADIDRAEMELEDGLARGARA